MAAAKPAKKAVKKSARKSARKAAKPAAKKPTKVPPKKSAARGAAPPKGALKKPAAKRPAAAKPVQKTTQKPAPKPGPPTPLQKIQALWAAADYPTAIAASAALQKKGGATEQPARHALLQCLIESGEDREAFEVYRHNKHDQSAVWRYGRALLYYRKRGDALISRRAIREAIAYNPHVPGFLIAKAKLPPVPDDFTPGSEGEAIWHAHACRKAWQLSKGALSWLKQRVNAPANEPELEPAEP